MKSLGDVIQMLPQPAATEDEWWHDPDYIARFLTSAMLPATDVLERERAELVNKGDDPDDGRFVSLLTRRTLEKIDSLLVRARRRDALQASRPEGCWCLGLGGKWPRHTADGERTFDECCGCAEGQAAAARKEELRKQAERAARAAYVRQLFGESKIPKRFEGCTFETYPVSPATRAALNRVRWWYCGPEDVDDEAAWDVWRRRRSSLLLHGPYGTGKTGLAVAVLHHRIAQEQEAALFFTVPSLLDAIRSTYGPNAQADEREVVEAVKSAPFLVLDDLGAERVTEWVAEKLFTVINHRHDEELPTVFTSNLDVAQLGQHIGERTTWRIVEMAEVVELNGPNLREQAA